MVKPTVHPADSPGTVYIDFHDGDGSKCYLDRAAARALGQALLAETSPEDEANPLRWTNHVDRASDGAMMVAPPPPSGWNVEGDSVSTDPVDRIADAMVERELNRHNPALTMQFPTSGFVSACCPCGWEWEGGWRRRTRESIDAIDAAIKQHLDDVTRPPGMRRR